MKEFSEVIEDDVYDILTIESCLENVARWVVYRRSKSLYAVDQAEKRLSQRDTSIVKFVRLVWPISNHWKAWWPTGLA